MSVLNSTVFKKTFIWQITVPSASAVTIRSQLSVGQLAELATAISDGSSNFTRPPVPVCVRIRNMGTVDRLNVSHKASPSTDVVPIEMESSMEFPVENALDAIYVQMASGADSTAQIVVGCN